MGFNLGLEVNSRHLVPDHQLWTDSQSDLRQTSPRKEQLVYSQELQFSVRPESRNQSLPSLKEQEPPPIVSRAQPLSSDRTIHNPHEVGKGRQVGLYQEEWRDAIL